MAVKIVRQWKKIALIGAPSSAGAFGRGLERAPAALRAAGLVDRLQAAGFEVADLGDAATRMFAQDDDHPRARNLAEVVAGLNDLKPRVEQAVKSGALPLVLGGECVQALGTIAGARRYYKHLNLVWMDRDADLNTPGTTPSGRVDGMGVAHIVGRGAPELVRFWGEPPLVREPDVTLFGLERLDPPEQEFLRRSPMQKYFAADVQQAGAAAAARQALERMHADARDFVLHVDVDVIAQEDFQACDFPGAGGLRLGDVREALAELARHKNLCALEVAAYNPEKDADGGGAKLIVELLAGALAGRFEALAAPEPPAAEQEKTAAPLEETRAGQSGSAAADLPASESPSSST